MRRIDAVGIICTVGLLLPTTAWAGEPEAASASAAAAPKLEMGNGESNRIETIGFTRDGRTFSFREVEVAGDSWLVLHPFRDAKPVGEIYVGATYVESGVNRDVSVTVQTAPEPQQGTPFLVMLHRDVNEDGTFDFVFVDERNVRDAAVFEGHKMIAHVIAAP
jgi:hypothetical protein